MTHQLWAVVRTYNTDQTSRQRYAVVVLTFVSE